MVPVFTGDIAAATRSGKLDVWISSIAENIRCAEEINKVLGREIITLSDVREVLLHHDLSRLQFVLSVFIQQNCIETDDFDVWAREIIKLDRLPEITFTCSGSMAALQQFVTYFRFLLDSRHLYTFADCEPVSRNEKTNAPSDELIGKILVISNLCLTDSYKTPNYQVGIVKKTVGSDKLLMYFPYDESTITIDCHDILGVLRKERYPDWLKV